MYENDFDFFCEPSEFEIQIDEFKEELRKSVKKEILDKIERLEKENKELREFRDQKREYEQKLNKAIRDSVNAQQNAKLEAERMSLKKYFGENFTVAYRAKAKYKKFKKCNRCDFFRRIQYKTPLGNETSEVCICNAVIKKYEPEELKLVAFNAGNDRMSSGKRRNMYYEPTSRSSDCDTYSVCNDEIYCGEDFEYVRGLSTVFFELEKCQEYCNWLNEKNSEDYAEYADKWGLVEEDD